MGYTLAMLIGSTRLAPLMLGLSAVPFGIFLAGAIHQLALAAVIACLAVVTWQWWKRLEKKGAAPFIPPTGDSA